MNLLVFVKQVFDSEAIVINPSGQIDTQKTPTIMSAYDKFALEAAVQLKEKFGGTVTALSLGDSQVESTLKEALSLGADKAVLVDDPAFAGSDGFAESLIISSAIKKLGNFDVIFLGQQETDVDDSQIGTQVAELLDIPAITHATKIEAAEDKITVTKKTDEDLRVVEATFPVLVTAEDTLNTPRYASIKSKMAAKRAKIEKLTADDIGVTKDSVGENSPTRVTDTFEPPKKGAGVVIKEDSDEASAKKLVELLASAKLI